MNETKENTLYVAAWYIFNKVEGNACFQFCQPVYITHDALDLIIQEPPLSLPWSGSPGHGISLYRYSQPHASPASVFRYSTSLQRDPSPTSDIR